jgi:hypothetical protein
LAPLFTPNSRSVGARIDNGTRILLIILQQALCNGQGGYRRPVGQALVFMTFGEGPPSTPRLARVHRAIQKLEAAGVPIQAEFIVLNHWR